MNHFYPKKGFSLLELIIVISILGILSVMSLKVFNQSYSQNSLSSATRIAESSLERARSLSLSVKDGITHGVRVESTRIIIFHGSSYVSGATGNEILDLPGTVNASTNLPGSDVIFSKLSGDADSVGTITLFLINSTTTQKVITIQSTGIITTT